MNDNYQLYKIATQYRKFSKGQYVEETQFNEFLDFFEDQDRLSRVMLEGVGIGCGFQPQLIYKNKQLGSILLSQGVAVTTDGDLLTLNKKSKTLDLSGDSYMSELKDIDLESKEYTHFKVYEDDKAKYAPFYNNPKSQIPLWELATAEEAKAGFKPLSTLTNQDDKYLLLYLESYEKEVKPCRGVDCDNHGIQQVRNLKVLLTSKAGIQKITRDDKIYRNHMVSNTLLTEFKLKRVILNPGLNSAELLRQAYKEALDQSNYDQMFRNVDSISRLFNEPIQNRTPFLNVLTVLGNRDKNFQYAYDIINDLAITYSEIIKLLPKSVTECLPDLMSFPKHIMLGKTIPTNQPDFARHKFYKSPVLDSERIKQRVIELIRRFKQQITEFRDPIGITTGIRITPSKKKNSITESAIPFYYEKSEKLLRLWNFDKTSNRAFDRNLSYDKTYLSTDLAIQKPLDYNIDNKPYFLIEGHQGGNYREIADFLQKTKDVGQLGFEIMSLSLSQLVDNKDYYKADFVDYVTKNPGLRHIGGVMRGGTFVIVYKSETDPTIIADFALPYVCCTPKSNIGLSLPSETICKNAKPIVFTVTPSNGEVKAKVATGLTGGVIKVNGQYLFNPGSVETALLNQEIGFTVNGKATNCTIKVLPQPNVTVVASRFDYPEGDSSRTTVTFKVTNDAGYDYKWDFLGNGAYVSLNPDSAGNVKYTYFKIDPRLPVNVIVTNNGCDQHIPLTNWYIPPTVEIKPPTVTIQPDKAALYLPDRTTTFRSTVVPGSAAISSYLWTCTDVNVYLTNHTGAITDITFPYSGSFVVKLTVKDANNQEGSSSITFEVGEKARIMSITVTPDGPTTNDIVVAQAALYNPSNITGLRYDWYVDGQLVDQTTVNTVFLGTLNVGQRKIEVGLGASTGNNHMDDHQVAYVNVTQPPMRGGTSFIAGTQITMAGGVKRNIEQVKAGDKLQSLNGNTVTVINAVTYMTVDRLYRLNEEQHFITGAHPVLTEGGWKSHEPEKTKEILPSLPVGLLQPEMVLIKEYEKRDFLRNVDFVTGEYRVYNLEVDGSKVYFANAYAVHSEIEPLPQP
ncbi:hypothetical protein [Flavobacterium cerinum]|uniref:PKD domain-containing protein n=1 Tax=Flavobacterium cerinum TaxID=2502784 RepID=A0ABY5IUM9_9FLAO|nr:hypothetical protein [Flavobacterium cerinum]UUC46530.1 hypothetical protein NOX80_04850 [Flavobacterium cerinum]